MMDGHLLLKIRQAKVLNKSEWDETDFSIVPEKIPKFNTIQKNVSAGILAAVKIRLSATAHIESHFCIWIIFGWNEFTIWQDHSWGRRGIGRKWKTRKVFNIWLWGRQNAGLVILPLFNGTQHHHFIESENGSPWCASTADLSHQKRPLILGGKNYSDAGIFRCIKTPESVTAV